MLVLCIARVIKIIFIKMKSPTLKQIRSARKKAGLTQTQAAELIYSTQRTWQDWESEIVPTKMHPAFFELFKIKTKI
jgi:putative transcriptional regulator